MQKYTLNPVTVDAVCYDGTNRDEIVAALGVEHVTPDGHDLKVWVNPPGSLPGWASLVEGDWVVLWPERNELGAFVGAARHDEFVRQFVAADGTPWPAEPEPEPQVGEQVGEATGEPRTPVEGDTLPAPEPVAETPPTP